MKVPNDIEDNSIVILIKHKGKIYTKGHRYHPDDYETAMKLARFMGYSIKLTLSKICFDRPLPEVDIDG